MATAALTALPYIIRGAGLVSSAMGLFGGSSSSESFKHSSALMQKQYDLYRQSRQTAYQDTRQSLEAAGYNPLLAVGQQATGSMPSATLNVQDPKLEKIQSAIGIAQAIANLKSTNSQVSLNKTQEDVNSATKMLIGEQQKRTLAETQAALANSAKTMNDITIANKLLPAQLSEILSRTKYNNERSRGFSKTESYSNNASRDLRGFSMGASRSNSSSYTNSTSW